MSHRSRIPELLTAIISVTFMWSCSHEYTYEVTGSVRDRSDTLQSGGVTRTYEVHLPVDHQDASSPVAIVLHGSGGNGLGIKFLSQFELDSEFYGFLAVYPNAFSDWAYGCGCTDAETNNVDDVQFVSDMIDRLDSDYGINRDSVFLVGYGEGALMAHKIACDETDSFAGLATVAGTMSVTQSESCVPTRELPVMMVHGSEDEDFPWGGALDRGSESVLGVDTVAQYWATNNGCGERLESVYVGTDFVFDFDIYTEMFDACPVGGNVVVFRMEGAEHGWPSADFSPSLEIVEFFVGDWSGVGTPMLSNPK
jgi:polyhydroxybutyrate depolymerase